MSERPANPPPDSTAGLKVFGVLLMAAGAVCGGLFLLVVAAVLLAPAGYESMEPRLLIPSSVVYLALGAGLVTLGIGSWRVRRWARPLILTLGWSWLIAGVLGGVLTVFLLPRLLEPYTTSDTAAALGCVVATMVLLWTVTLAFPIALVVYYSRPRIRALFDRRSPGPAWTDRTPPVLLGVAVLMWVGAVASLAALPYPALPIFGRMVSGWPLRLLLLAGAALCGWIGWAVYRRRISGFWALMGLQVIGLANLFAMRRIDEEAMLREMGYAEAQVPPVEIFGDPVFFWGLVASWLVLTLALFAIRKHFVPERSPGSPPPPPV